MQREKRLNFEDPKAMASDPDGSKYGAQEWMEIIERAKELSVPQSVNKSYSDGSTFNEINSSISSPASTFDADNGFEGVNIPPTRITLRKEQSDKDNESLRGVRRFSKRHSKSGLAAVF